MSIDMKPDNIVTICLCPAFVATDMTESIIGGGLGGKCMNMIGRFN
jgi:hypothetical protein